MRESSRPKPGSGRDGESTGTARVRWSTLVVLVLVLSVFPVRARTLVYTLEIPKNRSVTYAIPLEVRHPGRLSFHAEWSGKRTLSLRVDRPGDLVATARRAGPSPVKLALEVTPAMVGTMDWTLTIYSLAARGGGEGLLRIEIPDAPSMAVEARLDPGAVPPTESAPWMVRRHAPSGSPADWILLFETTERYRRQVEDAIAGQAPDHCRWQDGLMRFLAESRDTLVSYGDLPSSSTRRILGQIVASIRLVDDLRTSREALLTGPPPTDPKKRELWSALRRERIEAIELKLDETLDALRREHAPALAPHAWPIRLITCVAACERHFEERTRVGEEQAINRDLALLQWDRLLAAGDALAALSELRSDDAGLLIRSAGGGNVAESPPGRLP